MDNIKIEKLDNQGRGICFIDNKITFVSNTLPNEIVNIKLTKQNKKYNEAIVTKYIKTSNSRVKPICPYYNDCGGCDLMHLSYKDTLTYKKEKLENILKKYSNIETNIEIIPSNNNLNYRNKITLKVINSKYGYYISNTHKLVEIDNCYLAEPAIQNFIKDINKLNVINGEVVIRTNYNSELIIIIKTEDDILPDIEYLKQNHKIVGIVSNDKTLIGENHFIEIINHQLFNVSYDSFFQINRDICSKLFNLINNHIKENETILDLYCGVGTLGINASSKAKKAYGIEIVKNAVLNAISNSKINKRDNIYYMLGDVGKNLSKINDRIDTIIVDPPRAGLDNTTKKHLINFHPNKIIYVSCDPMTLARDIKELSPYYNIIEIKGLDMFPYTHHIETFCVMGRK